VDDIVIFNGLEKEDILKIVDIELDKLMKRIKKLGYQMKLSKKAKSFIGDKGFDKKYGARPLSRAIQKYLEDIIAEEIVNNRTKEGDLFSLDWDGKSEKLSLEVKA
jgi:ATP-dependent Clp protease ATP-binding subunit ClpC